VGGVVDTGPPAPAADGDPDDGVVDGAEVDGPPGAGVDGDTPAVRVGGAVSPCPTALPVVVVVASDPDLPCVSRVVVLPVGAVVPVTTVVVVLGVPDPQMSE
jgi:hypothetical protein